MQIGDTVQFVNESLNGIITRLIDEKTVGVSIEDGFEIPVLKKEIIVTSSKQQAEQQNSEIQAIRSENRISNSEISILFEQSSQTWYRASLVNNSNHTLLLSVSVERGQKFKSLYGGRVEKGTSHLFNTLDLAEMSQWGRYCFRIIFHEEQSDVPRAPWYIEYTFRSKDFLQAKELNGKISHSLPLKPDRIEQFSLIKDQLKIEPAVKPDQLIISRPEEVVDIHIQNLVKNYSEISAQEALEIQISHFLNFFEKAIALDYQKITIIHGVGNGTLKHKIWKSVSGHPAVKTYYEAKKEKFGYGATEILFK